MITLPKILDQGSIPACICFAVAGLANYYLQQKGIHDEIDALALYNATERSGGANARTVLNYGKDVGLPSISGKTYKIRDYQGVAQSISQMESAIAQHGGIIISYSMHDGDPFRKRLTTDFVLSRAPNDLHALIACDADKFKKLFLMANSWGTDFGNNGYFKIPYTLMRSEFLRQCFWFSLI